MKRIICTVVFYPIVAYLGAAVGTKVFFFVETGKIPLSGPLFDPLGFIALIGLGIRTPVTNILLFIGMLWLILGSMWRVRYIWFFLISFLIFLTIGYSFFRAWEAG
jgi:hypothetical protein